MADAVNLRAVGERVAFIQQLLIRIQHLFDVIVRARQCGVQVDKFAVARVAAFFRKAGERSLRNIEQFRNVARGQIRLVGIMNKKICYRPFQGSERGIDRLNDRNN